jgi:hypothetical protein
MRRRAHGDDRLRAARLEDLLEVGIHKLVHAGRHHGFAFGRRQIGHGVGALAGGARRVDDQHAFGTSFSQQLLHRRYGSHAAWALGAVGGDEIEHQQRGGLRVERYRLQCGGGRRSHRGPFVDDGLRGCGRSRQAKPGHQAEHQPARSSLNGSLLPRCTDIPNTATC